MDLPATSLTLLARLRATRDDDAWRDFVALYGPLVYRLACRKGLDSNAADNIVQAFCVRMLDALPRLEYNRTRGRFRKWALTVALNEIRMDRRRVARDQLHIHALADQQGGAETQPEIESWWEESERVQAVKLALERLRDESAPVHFGVFRMVVMDGKPAQQAAEAFSIKPQYVHGIASRMRRRLRDLVRLIRGSRNES